MKKLTENVRRAKCHKCRKQISMETELINDNKMEREREREIHCKCRNLMKYFLHEKN